MCWPAASQMPMLKTSLNLNNLFFKTFLLCQEIYLTTIQELDLKNVQLKSGFRHWHFASGRSLSTGVPGPGWSEAAGLTADWCLTGTVQRGTQAAG